MKTHVAPATAPAAVRWAAARLRVCVDSPEVDAELLIRHVTGLSRAQIYSEERDLGPEEAEALEAAVERRAGGEPLQYITGTQSFRGLELAVGPGVLVPRPETEILCDRALALIEDVESPVVVDVGTGSGAIALALAADRLGCRVWATEVSPEAIVWARRNAEITSAENVELLEGDLFDPLPPELAGRVDLIVSNPPYLTEEMVAAAAPDVRDHEPRVATVSGPTGLEVPGKIVAEAQAWLRPGGWLAMETWPGQAGDLQRLFEEAGFEAELRRDLAGSIRIVEGHRRGPLDSPA